MIAAFYSAGSIVGLEGWYHLDAGLLRLYRLLPDGGTATARLLFPGDTFYVPAYFELEEDLEALSKVAVSSVAEPNPKTRVESLESALLRVGRERAVGELMNEARVLALLGYLAEQGIGERVLDGTKIPLTHGALAACINSSRETVTKQLSALRRDGLVRGEHGASVLIHV